MPSVTILRGRLASSWRSRSPRSRWRSPSRDAPAERRKTEAVLRRRLRPLRRRRLAMAAHLFRGASSTRSRPRSVGLADRRRSLPVLERLLRQRVYQHIVGSPHTGAGSRTDLSRRNFTLQANDPHYRISEIAPQVGVRALAFFHDRSRNAKLIAYNLQLVFQLRTLCMTLWGRHYCLLFEPSDV